MKLSDAAKAMHGELKGKNAYFYGGASDTRKLKPGELFFAWQGESFDAHDFLESAEANGAIGAVVERFIPSAEISQIVVKDSQKALARIAKVWRKSWEGRCIGLTGSNGKTTLKEMLAAIFGVKYDVLATEGNYNNHVGCPLTLLQLSDHHTHAVIEMGASNPKEIDFLTRIVQPDIAILNNAGSCHLEGFGDLEGVAKAKAEIFHGLTDEGVAIINADDPFADFWRGEVEGKRTLTFGIENRADVYGTEIKGRQFKLNYDGQSIQISLNLLGRHNILNALAASAAAIAAGESLETIQTGLESLLPVAGRLQTLALKENAQIVNDAYNANPNSLRAGIDAFTEGERWLVLGDMRELGKDEIRIHQESGEYAKNAGFTKLFTLGDLAGNAAERFGEGAERFHEHAALLKRLQKAVEEYHAPDMLTILVKGSNSMNMQYFIQQLTAQVE